MFLEIPMTMIIMLNTNDKLIFLFFDDITDLPERVLKWQDSENHRFLWDLFSVAHLVEGSFLSSHSTLSEKARKL